MTDSIVIGEPAIAIRLRRDARARRMVLRVGRSADGPVMTLPPSVAVARAQAFALAQEGWLRRQIEAQPARVAVRAGLDLPYRGGVLTVARLERGRSSIGDRALSLVCAEAAVPIRAATLLREMARQRCLAASEAHAARLGRTVRRITLRDTRGRWGSCTAVGDLMFCWRLILAPDAVLDYVAAHEVAHLVEMNHSPAFWAVVAGLYPDYAPQRAWLRRHGPALMAYDFSAAA